MIGADSLGAHYLVCQIASAAVLLPVGYWLTSGYVFKAQRGIREFIRYSLAVLTNFPMQLLFVWLTKGLLNLPMTLVAPASVLFLGAWNYASSYWALSRSTGAEK